MIEKSVSMQELWFSYIMGDKKLWANGFTAKRLEKVKAHVLSDTDILFDLLIRHGGNKTLPAEMKANNPGCYDHCIGNFVCSILSKMMETGVIKKK